MGFIRLWVLLALILSNPWDAPAWANKPSCAERVTRLTVQVEMMRQELNKKLQPPGGKPDAKTAQALKAEQERLSKVDSLLREAGTAAQASNEPACREKVKAANQLLSCADRITGLTAQIEPMRQELTKKLQPPGGKPDAKTAQALKAEQERLSKVDSLLREAGIAAQASDEPACREKVKSAGTLLRP